MCKCFLCRLNVGCVYDPQPYIPDFSKDTIEPIDTIDMSPDVFEAFKERMTLQYEDKLTLH